MTRSFFRTFKTKDPGFKSRNRLLFFFWAIADDFTSQDRKLSQNITPPKTLDLSFAGFFNLLIESKFGVTQLHPKRRNCHWIWAASPGPVWVNFFRNECTWPKLKPFLMDPLELFQIWICLTNSHYCWD